MLSATPSASDSRATVIVETAVFELPVPSLTTMLRTRSPATEEVEEKKSFSMADS